ncbi:hypothetical protein GUITHDRAFT_154711 [Guillardia theta CCMP2712]|uniref:S5 DRBM domain-containing protein n=2 Tax=Guillardia theta TaxID=55529 RepID=L1IQU7_GUITC|nr:hypothetical protein GUITHDRAFT_154711 [Guillardia theta CCMP2712]EKX38452.1 hypothetical protein GUITHDRAFT_154711 [Guillardia theta CCMP2712]|eukprot:XP_005825432.1 hypothetical protein GUITHDRAFT_154711 [Guillardia theta CCMP2712]
MPDKRQSRPRRGRKPELIGDDKLPRLPIALTIDINKVALVRKGGKTIRFAALVICGNGKGVAAIGRGKDKEVAVAVEKAVWDAHKKKNIHYFETYDNRTMFHSVVTKYKKTKIIAMPARAGTGLQCSLNVARMCQAIGIKDIKVKIHGSTNAHNVTRGFWNALLQVMTPERYSEMTGRVLVDFASLSGGFGRGHTTLPKIDEKLDKML